MKKVHYTIDIKAPAEKVYKTMLGIDNKKTYEYWTSPFDPSSTYEGTWDKGSKILFIGFTKEGKRAGMVSEIADNIPHKFVSIRHKGLLDGDKEITTGPEVEKWANGLENYTFTETNGITTVTVDLDLTEEHIDYFNTMWPKALDKLKEMAEK